MPVSILISQSPHRDPQQREFEEQLVTELLMEDGLEVHVIPHFDQLQEDDTGRLCLESLTAHIIALSWLTPLDAFQQMQNLGAPGRFGRTNHAKQTPEVVANLNHPRTIYNLDLSRFSSVRECRDEVKRIIDEQSVEVVSIGGLQLSGTSSPTKHSPEETGEETAKVSEPTGTSDDGEKKPSSAAPQPPVDWDDDDQLDRLVDDLDNLDI